MKVQVNVEIVKIGPDKAQELLANRWESQRDIRESHVRRLVEDMKEGRFKIGPDCLVVIQGKLANGQHRLTAVVESGLAQTFLMMHSNDDELYKIMDCNLKRTASDGLKGMPFAKNAPSIARWVLSYDNDRITQRGTSSSALYSGKVILTNALLIDYCHEHEKILSEAAAFVNPLYQQTKVLPLSVGAAVYALASRNETHKAKVRAFLEDVYVNGGKNAAGDLHNRLVSVKGSKTRLHAGYMFGITLKAFKSHLNGTRPATLRWSEGEEMPRI